MMLLGRGPRPAAARSARQRPPPAPQPEAAPPATAAPAPSAPPLAVAGLHARPVDATVAPGSLGSLDPLVAKLFLEFAGGPEFADSGGGLARITFSEFLRSTAAK